MTRGQDYVARYQENRREPLWLLGIFIIVVVSLLLAHDWFFAAGWIL